MQRMSFWAAPGFVYFSLVKINDLSQFFPYDQGKMAAEIANIKTQILLKNPLQGTAPSAEPQTFQVPHNE
jgi:hypothetical protein